MAETGREIVGKSIVPDGRKSVGSGRPVICGSEIDGKGRLSVGRVGRKLIGSERRLPE